MKFFLKKIELKNLVKFFEILVERALFTFFILSIFALIFGGFLFFKYYFLIKKSQFEIEKPVEFKKRIYLEVLKAWQEREKRFNEAKFKNYLNPFLPQ